MKKELKFGIIFGIIIIIVVFGAGSFFLNNNFISGEMAVKIVSADQNDDARNYVSHALVLLKFNGTDEHGKSQFMKFNLDPQTKKILNEGAPFSLSKLENETEDRYLWIVYGKEVHGPRSYYLDAQSGEILGNYMLPLICHHET